MTHRTFKFGGFSLIEMVVYISILVFALVLVLNTTTSLTRSDRILKSARSLENSAISVLERVSREVKLSQSVDVTNSILGSHPGKLVLKGQYESGGERTIEFYLTGTDLRMKEDGVDRGSLIRSDVRVTNLQFNRSATSTSEGIRTVITLDTGTSTHYKVETFQLFSTKR